MSPDPSASRTQVLVVGAGPTGLMAAYLLHRKGLDVRVIDKNASQSNESRAGVVSARSIELFASLGLAERMFARGTITTKIDLFVSGQRAGGLNYSLAIAPDTPYRFILMIPQSETEQVLLEALEERGVTVERGTEAVDIRQDREGVTATLACHGRSMAVSADYMIGADGAHSTIRHTLGCRFDGAKYPQAFLLGDVNIDWPYEPGRFRVFMHRDRIGLCLPWGLDGRARVMTTETSNSATPDNSANLELADLETQFTEVVRAPVRLSEPVWLTRFSTHHRVVDRMRSGRIFLAGDAAHIHSPAGGQGMNTGLQDAANLAWKIACVTNGQVLESILATYETERLPVAQDVLRLTDRLFGAVAGLSGVRARIRDVVAPTIIAAGSRLAPIQRAAFRTFGQLDINYGSSAVVREGTKGKTLAQPGRRAPNAGLTRHRDVFDLISGYLWTLLVLSRRSLTVEETDNVVALARQTSFHIAVVSPGRTIADVPMARPDRDDVFTRYGVDEKTWQALLIVRPDGVIAWRCDHFDVRSVPEFLAQTADLSML